MKFGKYAVILTIALAILAGSLAQADHARKLPIKAYISGAKIEILNSQKEPDRIYEAIAMLDSLFMYYGPHAEGLYWMAKIQADFISKTGNLKKKQPYVAAMVAYVDSLHMCCENKDIDKKHRKHCDKFTEELDSANVLFWRNYYNAGVNQVTEAGKLLETVKEETDSTALAYYETRLEALIDSCQDNMSLAITIDPTDPRPYIGIASVYEKKGDYSSAVQWLQKAEKRAADKRELLSKIAYNYIYLDDYCGAVPYFRQYIDLLTADDQYASDPQQKDVVLSTMYNLAVCFNRCEMPDSAYAVYQDMLVIDPQHCVAFSEAGRHHSAMARAANDSSNVYRDAGDDAKVEEWREIKDASFDSALVYYKKAFDCDTTSFLPAVEYGVTAILVQDYASCVEAFERATKLDTTDADSWTSLGDCLLRSKEFARAAEAYEKAVALNPDRKAIWESLRDLHLHLGNKERAKEIEGIISKM